MWIPCLGWNGCTFALAFSAGGARISDSSDWGAVEGSDLVPLVHRENQRPIARRKLDLHTGPYQDRVTLAVPTG